MCTAKKKIGNVRLFCIQSRIDKMLGFICIALMALSAFGYQWNQRYNHWHVGTWQIFPEECDPYCFPHVDRFAVKIWKPLGSTCPQEIDEEDVKNSIFELDPDLVCSGVRFVPFLFNFAKQTTFKFAARYTLSVLLHGGNKRRKVER